MMTSKETPTRFFGIMFLFGRDATSDSNAGTGLLAVGDVSVDGSPALLALSVVAVVAADACESTLLVLWLHLVLGLSSVVVGVDPDGADAALPGAGDLLRNSRSVPVPPERRNTCTFLSKKNILTVHHFFLVFLVTNPFITQKGKCAKSFKK